MDTKLEKLTFSFFLKNYFDIIDKKAEILRTVLDKYGDFKYEVTPLKIHISPTDDDSIIEAIVISTGRLNIEIRQPDTFEIASQVASKLVETLSNGLSFEVSDFIAELAYSSSSQSFKPKVANFINNGDRQLVQLTYKDYIKHSRKDWEMNTLVKWALHKDTGEDGWLVLFRVKPDEIPEGDSKVVVESLLDAAKGLIYEKSVDLLQDLFIEEVDE